MIMTLPYPPSANHYWRRVGTKTLISREGRAYRKRIGSLLAGGGPPYDGRLALMMDAFPPDRRRRDLDNLQKPTLDALEKAGVYWDDSQIDLLITRRAEVMTPGQLIVNMTTLPLRRCPLCGHPIRNESEHCHDN